MKSGAGNILRKSLVVFQFSASVFLIVGSLVVYYQLQFMKHQDLGLTINETMVLRGPGSTDSTYRAKYESFKTEVMRIPGAKSIASSSFVPGDEIFWTCAIKNLTADASAYTIVASSSIDEEFIPSYDVKVLAGRNFNKSFQADNERIILNRALAKMLGYNDPEAAIGQKLIYNGNTLYAGDTVEVVGVVEDFHQMSLKNRVAPLAMVYNSTSEFYAIKMETSDYHSIVDGIGGTLECIIRRQPYRLLLPR